MNNKLPFKRIFWCYTFCALPFCLLTGILSLLNIVPANFNDKPVYGIEGFIIELLFMPFFALIFSCLTWLALAFGGFLYDAFMRMFKQKNDSPTSQPRV
jgi:hypothetical protein